MIVIRPMHPEELPAAKVVMLTVAAGIFEPDHPAANFVNRHSAALSDVDDYQRHYGEPDGTFLVAIDGDVVIGTGAVRPIDGETAELRRMWLLPAYHGRGVGYRLFRELEAFARDAGYRRMRLSTTTEQQQAIRFYTRQGFFPIERYRDTDDEMFMEFILDAAVDEKPLNTDVRD